MGNGNRQSALLVEIIIAVLFFALSATVILDVFATAYRQTAYAADCNAAMAEAQNLSERIYASDAPEELLDGEGFAREGDLWRRDGEDYALEVTLGREDAAAGELRRSEVRALSGDRTLIAIPGARYIPEEVAQ